jgi:hypothetical protein
MMAAWSAGLMACVCSLAACGAVASSRAKGRGGGCPSGVVHVSSAEDVAALVGCTRLAGLTVRTGAAVSLTGLAQLAEIEGDLVVGPTLSVDAVDLPQLERVGGSVRIAGNSQLVGVFLPELTAARWLEIEHNASLGTVSMPKLAEAERLVVRDNAGLEALSINELTRVGELVLEELPRLGLLQADRLARVTRWKVGALPALEADRVNELRARAGVTSPEVP